MSSPFQKRTIWQGVPLGFDRGGNPIDYDGNAPILCFGPPGSYKTVGVIANQLLDEPGKRSFIVIDPKGEIFAITSKYRRKVCGADNVKVSNAYGLLLDERADAKSDGFNPLGDLDPALPSFGDDCQAKGDALIKTGSNESQPHFPDSARSGSTATIMWEVKDAAAQIPPVPPSLANVRRILTMDSEKLREFVEQKMMGCGDYDIETRAAKFLADNTEIQNIKSTIETQTAWMTKPMRDEMYTSTGIDFRECTKRPMTIYIIIPAIELQAKATFLRLVLSSALRALYRHGGVPATVIVEEGFVIGHHAEIEQALSILRGFNSRLLVVFHSLQQINKLYPETWGLFTAGAVLGFRPADLETAEWLVKKAGEGIVPVLSASDPSNPADVGVRPSWQQQKRERIPLAKMFGMPQGRALVWLPHDEAPRVSRVRGYFDIPALNSRASANPYYTGPAASAAVRAPGRKVTASILAAAAVIAGGAWLFNTTGAIHPASGSGVGAQGGTVHQSTPKPGAGQTQPKPHRTTR